MDYGSEHHLLTKISEIFESYDLPYLKEDHAAEPLLEKAGSQTPQDLQAEREKAAQSEELLTHARIEAEQLKADALQELDELRSQANREGWEKGYEEGVKAGKAEGVSECREMMEVLSSLVEGAKQSNRQILTASSSQVLELVMEIAEKVVGKELSQNPDTVLNIVAKALRRAVDQQRVKVLVHPADLAIIKDNEALLESEMGGRALEIYPSNKVNQGGCVLETEIGSIDGQVETQLSEVEKVLRHKAERLPPQ